ncbi:MAG: hypothetical protein AAB336_07245 [Acidobacteriota bacterium]
MKNSKFKIQNLLKAFCIFFFVFLISCVTGSIPNLDEPQCAESREMVKKFYSIHFDGRMLFSKENLKLQERFLSPEFYTSLENLQTENDVFTTNSADIPRAFRLGNCKLIETNKTNVEILLLWRNESESRQQIINAEVINQNDKWLINKILR